MWVNRGHWLFSASKVQRHGQSPIYIYIYVCVYMQSSEVQNLPDQHQTRGKLLCASESKAKQAINTTYLDQYH